MLTALRRLFGTSPEPEKALDPKRLPKHIAVIMDGNGRWAQKRGLPRIAGHRAGAKVVREVIKAASALGIGYLTLFAFSAENWRRPKTEVSGLMKLFEQILRSELEELHENQVKIEVIGDLANVSEGTRHQFEKAIARTAENTGLHLIVALNYSGRTDIMRAVNEAVERAAATGKAFKMDETDFSAALATAGVPDPELIIRTSGELRLSNFLTWEGAYAEFWVTENMWPDFGREDFMEAVRDYQRRERRFGGLAKDTSAR